MTLFTLMMCNICSVYLHNLFSNLCSTYLSYSLYSTPSILVIYSTLSTLYPLPSTLLSTLPSTLLPPLINTLPLTSASEVLMNPLECTYFIARVIFKRANESLPLEEGEDLVAIHCFSVTNESCPYMEKGEVLKWNKYLLQSYRLCKCVSLKH